MSITSYIGSFVSSINKKKTKKVNNSKPIHSIHLISKEQHFKWLEEGKCQCCGDESGEFKGICDDCRLF